MSSEALAQLFQDITATLTDEPFWATQLERLSRASDHPSALHVAVFQEPFLSWILDGRKTVESRFSKNRVAPYAEVREGDIIALKTVGGPVVGICGVSAVWNYRLSRASWAEIRDRFAPMLGDDVGFLDSRHEARFATLISICHPTAIAPIPFPKRDRRGWVVYQTQHAQQGLAL